MATAPALAVLPNFPFKDQLTEKSADGYPPENARFDCVATSFAAAIQYYDGGYVSGDELKDAEYGETYANAGTALRRYIDDATDLARAKYHVNCVPYNNNNTVWLVGRIHTWLKQGYPVIATIPSQWGNAYDMATLAQSPFSTHVIVFFSEEGGLTAMNPWGGFRHTGSDAYWQARLCDGQIWAVVKESANVSGVPSGWKDDGKTLIAPNGVPVVRGFRTYVLAQNWQPNNWPLKPEMAVAQIEPGNAAMGKGARQDFRMTSLGCQQHADGSWGSPYMIYVGQDLLALETQLAAALAHVSQLEAQVADLQKQPAPAPQPIPIDPKASEALAALVELAKALKLVEPAA